MPEYIFSVHLCGVGCCGGGSWKDMSGWKVVGEQGSVWGYKCIGGTYA